MEQKDGNIKSLKLIALEQKVKTQQKKIDELTRKIDIIQKSLGGRR